MESSNVQTIQDSVAYDLQSLIGEVGGTLGLFLGLSAMSFVDFVGFIYRKAFPNWISEKYSEDLEKFKKLIKSKKETIGKDLAFWIINLDSQGSISNYKE